MRILTVPTWDLESLLLKAIDHEEGYGWTLNFALDIVEEYRLFAALCRHYPDEPIVPSTFVDDFWRLHILDTQKYAEDCQQHYGYFLHRLPYLEMYGEANTEQLKRVWLHTLEMYQLQFGPVPAALWPRRKRHPNCGVRCRTRQGEAYLELRPSMADLVRAMRWSGVGGSGAGGYYAYAKAS